MHSNGRVSTASEFSIDGLEPERIVAPATAQAMADTLAEAAASGLGVAPVGGGTTLNLGNPIERYDLAASTTQLHQILDYEPMDLVLSAQAGARFADVQAALAQHGQHLPVETPFPDRATIGGMIATARSGPRRLSSGTLRDLLIGMSLAHASGTVTKCGGMVVKNVSGYDMPRVYHGSLGTLGVITSANFKVVPLPRAERTLFTTARTFDDVATTVSSLQASGLPFVALELFTDAGGWRVAVRCEGRERSVHAIAASTRDAFGSDVEELEDGASRQWWQDYIDDQSSGEAGITVRSSVRPRQSLDLVRAITRCLDDHQIAGYRLWSSPGLGVVQTRWNVADDGSAVPMRSLIASLAALSDHSVVLSAPTAVKRGIDVWGAAPETLDLMRQLKHEFDPARVLNPGRFVGHV